MNKVVIEAKVVHGQGKGHKMGFATVNQDTSELAFLPEVGVYAARVYIGKEQYIGVTNVGTRPTVDNKSNVTIETHILDYDKDLYDQIIKVELCYYLRGVMKFSGPKELYQQIKKDSEQARKLLQ